MMNFVSLAFAQGTGSATPAPAGGSFLVLLPMYAIIFGVFYFFLIRPQQKKQQEQQNMINQLKKNDEVITTGGMHGTIANIKDNSVVLKVADNVKIEFVKSAIGTVKKSRQS